MKKLFLSMLLLALPLLASAYDAEVDGIYYNLIPKGNVAEVTFKDNNYNSYSGSITIPEKFTYEEVEYTVTIIGNYAFQKCRGLTSVTIPNSVTIIGYYAFYYCGNLNSVTFGNSVTSIGEYAFGSCSGLTSLTIPNSVTNIESIGEYAFGSCSGLTSLTIPNSVTNIGNYAFQSCSGLTSITIPNSVTTIGSAAFQGCNGLTSLVIPNSLTTINGWAFEGCSGLTSVTIPISVKRIEYAAFRGCTALNSVYITDLEAWCNISFNDNPLWYAHHIYLNGEEITDLVISNSVKSIGGSAFRDCTGLTSVIMGNSVTSIGDWAFSGCSSLTSVTIGNSVTSIGGSAFYGCSGLTSVTIPNSVTSIGGSAFSDCGDLTSVTIGSSVRSIGERAFMGCSKLEEVYCLAENVPSTYTNVFEKCYPEYTMLYVPAVSLNAYKTTAPWSQFGTIKDIEGSGIVPEIKKCALPTINYADKELSFSCETEDVEYVYEIKDSDVKKGYDSRISLSATYVIRVYATKTGYENSDIATATLVWADATFTETDPETPTSAKAVQESIPVLISANGGVITVKSEQEGQAVAVYTADGKALGSATVKDGQATVATNMQRGEIVIVKVGGRSVKVKM